MSRHFLMPFACAALVSAGLTASSSSAALLDVTISTDISAADFTLGTDSVFGVAPGDFTYALTLRVDTSAASFAAAGDPTDTFTFAHDVFGYNLISATASFGSKTWDSSDFVSLSFGDGIANSILFVNEALVAGATPDLASLRMQDADGFLFVGVRSCGGSTCQITENVQIRDFNGIDLDGGNDSVATSNYSIAVSDAGVPEPGPMSLFALGLVGLGYARRRSSVA